MTFEPSQYQIDFFDEMKNGFDNIVLDAKAGSGKTTTIIKATELLPKKSKVGFICFNKHIREELETKVPKNIRVRTFHQLGVAAIYKNLGKDVPFDNDKVKGIYDKEITKYELNLNFNENRSLGGIVKKLVSLLKGNGVEPTKENIVEIMNHHSLEVREDLLDINPVFNMNEFYKLIKKVYLKSATNLSVYDYDDMVFLPVYHKWECQKFDYLFVDELQDVNKIQIELIERSLADDGRIIGVGDKHQCHPPNTMISLTGGKTIPIQDIKEGMEVVSYSTGRSYFKGVNVLGRKVEQVASREYEGEIINFSSGMRCTPNHKILVKQGEISDNKYIVYLMKKDESYRVGMCKSVYKHNTKNLKGSRNSGLNSRCRSEKADAGWILTIADSQQEAFIIEQVTQAKFGLPSITFNSDGTHQANMDVINKIYEQIGDNEERAIKCLESFGRMLEFPAWSKDFKGLLTRPHIIQACNYIDGLHIMKYFNGGTKDGEWKYLTTTRTNEKTIVYSLKVEPTEGGKRLYVADNTVVHNSIYGFRGSDVNSIPKFVEKFDAKIMPLSISYRCPIKHIELAQGIVPEIEHAPNAIDGAIEWVDDTDIVDIVEKDDLIICRNNAPLIRICLKFIGSNKRVTIKGADFGNMLNGIIKSFKTNDVKLLSAYISVWLEEKVEQAEKDGSSVGYAYEIHDSIQTLVELFEDSDVKEIMKYVNQMFSDKDSPIVLSTIHKAKGLEADNVFIIYPHLMPSPYALQKWEKIQESNMRYVAYTRSKKNIYMVRETKKKGNNNGIKQNN